MSYYIGIDGGGTSTTIVIGDHQKREIGRFDLGPSNYHIIGIEGLKSLFAIVLDEIRNRYLIEAIEVVSLSYCGAGVDCSSDEVNVRRAISEAGFKNSIFIANDALGAIVGANGKEEGAILVSGTGSIALGIEKGISYRVGGWGHLIDDDGSGYWIAKEALRKVFQAHDGRGEKTLLEEMFLNHLKCTCVEDIIGFIYHKETKKQHVAELAQYVFAYYHSDAVANVIINEASQGLFDMGYALMKNMNKEALIIKGCGSILSRTTFVMDQLNKISESICPYLKFEFPDQDAATGALMLAYLKERKE